MNFNSICNGVCSPPQIITFKHPFRKLANEIKVYHKSSDIYCIDDVEIEYDNSSLQFSWSIDSVCWSCFTDYSTAFKSTNDLGSDFYLKVRVQGGISRVVVDGDELTDISISLQSGFNFSYCSGSSNTNMYNPYANMECAISLQQNLAETVACMFGIPCYYFKVDGVKQSEDITFKEYCLKSVSSVKEIKLMIKEGTMPSSRPEFADFGLDFNTDWETEITKGMFANAFGSNVQPTEGDLIYIPMMQRMWMVNESYEEKNANLMWKATTFTVTLVKYQIDKSVDKGISDELIDNLVQTKYEDLFGDQETLDSGTESLLLTTPKYDNLFPIYKSDSNRKYISVGRIEVFDANTNGTTTLYHKGSIISDSYYKISDDGYIEYQRQYCGSELTLSFLINFNNLSSDVINMFSIGDDITINLHVQNNIVLFESSIGIVEIPNVSEWYFVILRISDKLNCSDISVYQYKYPSNIPLYKLQSHHYYFDIDNPIVYKTFNNVLGVDNKSKITIEGGNYLISNIKIFDIYINNISEILQQYPSNQHLLVNDSVRPLYGLNGKNQN